jgi:nitroreductase
MFMEILGEIINRVNASGFKKGPLDKNALERILESGRLSPSAKNRQPWRFIAVTDDDQKQKMSDACYGDQRIADAGCVIAACTTNIQYIMPNGQLSYPIDIGFAVSFMTLQAEHEGLGSAVTATFDEISIKDILSVPYTMRVVLLLAIGNKEENQKLKDRFSASRIISYDHW